MPSAASIFNTLGRGVTKAGSNFKTAESLGGAARSMFGGAAAKGAMYGAGAGAVYGGTFGDGIISGAIGGAMLGAVGGAGGALHGMGRVKWNKGPYRSARSTINGGGKSGFNNAAGRQWKGPKPGASKASKSSATMNSNKASNPVNSGESAGQGYLDENFIAGRRANRMEAEAAARKGK